jgi:hypothetical protein
MFYLLRKRPKEQSATLQRSVFADLYGQRLPVLAQQGDTSRDRSCLGSALGQDRRVVDPRYNGPEGPSRQWLRSDEVDYASSESRRESSSRLNFPCQQRSFFDRFSEAAHFSHLLQ